MNPKLLVVDDERGIVDMIQSYFQTRYDILTAYSGQEALKKVAYKPDLILLDINMPGMDGLTVCQKIREHIACPILFLTARIEYAEFAERLSAYNMSQAEFIRQAITGAAIRPIITVSPVNDELLAAVGKLTAEYGRIGGNLNQIARTLNEWHSPYPQLAGEVRAAVSDLAALKFEVLQKVGDAVGNIQTYQL